MPISIVHQHSLIDKISDCHHRRKAESSELVVDRAPDHWRYLLSPCSLRDMGK